MKTSLDPRFLGLAANNPFIANVSSPRAVMDANHMSQRVNLVEPDTPLVQTGIEYELAKYINDVRSDHDNILKSSVFKHSELGDLNPETTMLVEHDGPDGPVIDYIKLPRFKSNHGFFGYELEPTETLLNANHNSPLPKGTILGKTKSHGPHGTYNYGLNANVVFMSHPSVAEDGFVVSESYLKKMRFTTVTKRTIYLTKDNIPINLYGDNKVFKMIPDIGEMVRPDGLLCATRERNDWFSITDLNNNSLSEVDHTFDTPTYVPVNSRVVDINVIKGSTPRNIYTDKMYRQLEKYSDDLVAYYDSIISRYENLIKEKKRMFGREYEVKQTPRLRRFIADLMKIRDAVTTGRQKLVYRKIDIEYYRVEVTCVSEVIPNLGFKLSDEFAAKGVICRILPEEDMPIDEFGNRADIITDATSTFSRMNNGRAYLHYMGAFSRDNRNRLYSEMYAKYQDKIKYKLNKEDVEYILGHIRNMYELVNSDMLPFIDGLKGDERRNHALECILENIYIYYPTNNERNIVDVIADIEKSPYKPHMGKLTYTDELGRKVTTVEDMRVGVLYMLVLEKIAMDYAAVSSAKVNSFNFPIKGNNQIDRYKHPHSLTPTTVFSETEVRILASFADPVMIAESLDAALNPLTHKQIVKGILNSPVPFDENFDINREDVPYGQTKSLMLLKHVCNASGFDFVYTEEE